MALPETWSHNIDLFRPLRYLQNLRPVMTKPISATPPTFELSTQGPILPTLRIKIHERPRPLQDLGLKTISTQCSDA